MSLSRTLFRLVEATNRRFSRVGPGPIFEAGQFDWLPAVEACAKEIQEELRQVLASRHVPQFHEALPGQEPLNRDRGWRSFFLLKRGERLEENARLCPKTMEALARIPGVRMAFFSILAPGKHIPAHRGPYNGVLRYHLALVAPEGSRIRVGDARAEWREGRSLVFDDSYDHEVWNDAASERVVLFVDFLRPLPAPIDWINRLVIEVKARRREARTVSERSRS